MCTDIANFYLNKPMNRYEYIKLPLDIIPEEIIQQYNLRNLEHKGFVYMKLQKGMYGLPQAGKIDSDASYLSEPRARSRNGGHYYLSSLPTNQKNHQTSRH